MLALFVHGMGRTPFSAWPLLYRLRQAGLQTTTFGYSTTFENSSAIKRRLSLKVAAVASTDNYIIIAHSLGGVLIRDVLDALPPHIARPRHVFLLGSPIQAARLAVRLKDNRVYRAFTGDCGQLLASPARMHQIAALTDPATGIVGVRGIGSALGPFNGEPNDGVVALSEVSAPWLTHQKQVDVIHTFLPSSSKVAKIILDEICPNSG